MIDTSSRAPATSRAVHKSCSHITASVVSLDKTSAAVGPAFRQIATDVIQQFHILPSESVRANDPATW